MKRPFITTLFLIGNINKEKCEQHSVFSTGIFVAPVAGLYYFTFFYHAGGERPVVLSLYKNNQLVVMTSDHQTDADGADNGGNAAFLQLRRGDQVHVRLDANRHVWGYSQTTFSGFLFTQI